MNKAFVRESDPDAGGHCPRCGALGAAVRSATLDAQVIPQVRSRMSDSAWFCTFARCQVAYFDQFEAIVTVDELRRPVYPKDAETPICACFGFGIGDIEADVRDGAPTRIRALLEKSKSPDAHCVTAAADGQCCMREVQRLYIKMRESSSA
jgi:hypothetical protein